MTHIADIQNKISSNISSQLADWKNENLSIVFTNGCFDILHKGHIDYLAKSADLGDRFIVAINSDDSVKRQKKGANRPLQDESSRAMIMAALTFVDAVVIFDEDTPVDLITQIVPDYLVKGGDYDPSITDKSDKAYIVGSDVVNSNGGKAVVIPYVEGYSTSKIEEKIKNS